MRLTDLRVIHAGLSVRAAEAVETALADASDPLAVQFREYLTDELNAAATAPEPVAEPTVLTPRRTKGAKPKPKAEPATKRVARKMAAAGAKAAKAA